MGCASACQSSSGDTRAKVAPVTEVFSIVQARLFFGLPCTRSDMAVTTHATTGRNQDMGTIDYRMSLLWR